MSIGSYLKQIFGPEYQTGRYDVPPVTGQVELPAFEQRVPRLAAVRSAPSREEFAAWRDHPVTQFVFAAMRAVAEEQEQSWHDQSWNGGNCDPVELNGLRARADTYTSMEEGGYESFCEWAGVEPEPLVVEQGEWGRL
jgi:hypothetical protein